MKLKSHAYFWSFAAFMGALMYSFPMIMFVVLLGIGVLIYVLRFVYDRRAKAQPKPKKKEQFCCKRCSGEEPWPDGRA